MQKTATQKHIFTNLAEQSSVRLTAERLAQALTNLVNSWHALNIGEFTEELLNGDPKRSSSSSCQSCKGLRNYTKGELLIQDYLLDLAGSVSVGSGLRLSRERLRDVIEMPEAGKIKDFEKAFRAYQGSSGFGYPLTSPFVEIQNGRVVILEEEMEQHCKTFEKHLTNPEDIQLHDDLEGLLKQIDSVNSRLAKKNLDIIRLDPKTATNSAISLYNGSKSINNAVLASYLR
jgi:hypothetical protein